MKCLQVNFKWQGDRDNLLYVMQDDGLFQTDIACLCTYDCTYLGSKQIAFYGNI